MASEYGWAKHEIFYETYLDEIVELVEKINRRKFQNIKLQLSIAQNPFAKDPKALWNALDAEEAKITGRRPSYLDAKLDKSGFEMLKQRLRENPRIKVK